MLLTKKRITNKQTRLGQNWSKDSWKFVFEVSELVVGSVEQDNSFKKHTYAQICNNTIIHVVITHDTYYLVKSGLAIMSFLSVFSGTLHDT